jgi:hypothetical protein
MQARFRLWGGENNNCMRAFLGDLCTLAVGCAQAWHYFSSRNSDHWVIRAMVRSRLHIVWSSAQLNSEQVVTALTLDTITQITITVTGEC